MERSSGAAPPLQLLTVEVEREDGEASIVSLAGELDLSTISTAEKRLFEELRTHSAVIMDLTRLSFIDSSGIGMLIQGFRAREREEGGELHTVIARDSQIERVFRLAGIDRALPLYQDRAAALAATNGGRLG